MPKSRKPKEQKEKKIDLKQKLREKLQEKKLERTSKIIRNKMLDSLENRLEKSKNQEEKNKIKKDIELLEKIEEKELNQGSEYPDYFDGGDYGGAMERSE